MNRKSKMLKVDERHTFSRKTMFNSNLIAIFATK